VAAAADNNDEDNDGHEKNSISTMSSRALKSQSRINAYFAHNTTLTSSRARRQKSAMEQ